MMEAAGSSEILVPSTKIHCVTAWKAVKHYNSGTDTTHVSIFLKHWRIKVRISTTESKTITNTKSHNSLSWKLKIKFLRFEVFTAMTMKNGVFWDVMPCGSCKNRSFRGMYHPHHQGDKM
jgi:hypothetical protein